jgi:CPA2 family monovalent cation:H+ antiporter-2
LRELDIRRSSGATVIAIVRNGEAITNPGAEFTLQVDDILVLLGAHKELDAALDLLKRGEDNTDAGDGVTR